MEKGIPVAMSMRHNKIHYIVVPKEKYEALEAALLEAKEALGTCWYDEGGDHFDDVKVHGALCRISALNLGEKETN